MDGPTKEGIPGGVDQVDETVRNILVFLGTVERAAIRWVDSSTKRDQARLPLSSDAIRPCSRCPIYERSPSLRKGEIEGFSDT